ncbi:hypothetical protein H6P81_016405 [Aristolochia fimbriata]|uniref:glucan endo-1,3-beta-D-glucosidase n=1 Tax=Aristolochia fimbriata TaxID=158543 RepID=A0AAV7E858_ARIFI|nr:hypothetical protein H6P81_016405 [Aristolochia fimbriata]
MPLNGDLHDGGGNAGAVIMRKMAIWTVVVLWVLLTSASMGFSLGVNWGRSSSHPLAPATVVAMLQANNVSKVKLFDVDPLVMEALSGSKIDVMVGIPNEMLRLLNASKKAAVDWVHNNVTRYVDNTGGGGVVNIEYIAIGDEPFLHSYGELYKPFVLGAATNIQLALIRAKLGDKIKVVVPCNYDVIQSDSYLPSKASFRPDVNKTMSQLLPFLNKHASPFVINLNPFLTLLQSKNFSIEQALFLPISHSLKDGHKAYNNTFDASIDSLATVLSKMGFGNMDIMVGQVGWPTDGSVNASSSNAQSFMSGLVDHLESKVGTPLRPRRPPIETYLFSLLDEDLRSVSTGNYERHWGIFTFDGQAKYRVDLGQGSGNLVNSQNVDYLPSKWCVVDNNKDMTNASTEALNACSSADCTSLFRGGSCFNITWPGNVSYAFNSFYQQQDQRADSCDFGGLGLITTVDPSVGECRFAIGLRTSFSCTIHYDCLRCWVFILIMYSFVFTV